jgi:uncharacterized protein YecT (DUF1311 family)
LPILVALVVAAAALAPPVIHEPFTPLPCPIHPDTTIDVEGCQEMRVLRTDRAIDGQVSAIFHLLQTQSARAKLVRAEGGWLHGRRRSCAAAASVQPGRLAAAIALLSCTLRANRTHLAALVAKRRTLSPRPP